MIRRYYTDMVDRAVRTFAQAEVALIGTNSLGLTDVDWKGVASAGALAAVLSLLTTLGQRGLFGRTDAPDAD